jgi:hypothetical protein
MQRDHRSPGGDAQRSCASALPGQAATECGKVGIDTHQGARRIECNRRRRDLERASERIASTTDVESPSDRTDEIAPSLPNDPIGELPLYLQAFLSLHPRIDPFENVVRMPCDDTACSDPRTTKQFRGHATAIGWQRDTRAFLRKCLTQMLRRQADFLSELENLRFGEHFLRLARSDLQLGRPR